MAQCTARSKRSGKQCKKDAVIGGTVCHIHGGKTPTGVASPHFKTGRYSRHLPAQIATKLSDSGDDPMDLLPELDVQRALFADYMSRFEIGTSLTAGDINMLMQWSSDIGRMVERITKMRNETALTGAELAFLAARIADLVSKYIDDPAKQRAFVADLFADIPTSNRSEITVTA